MLTKIELSIIAAVCLMQTPAFSQTAPPQQSWGPGGSAYPYGGAVLSGPFGDQSPDGPDVYYIDQPSFPAPADAPVVLFLHGYEADTVDSYRTWMDHMARMGYTVVWVQYDVDTQAEQYLDRALLNFHHALETIESHPGFVPPSKDRNGVPVTGIVGHSAGAYLSFGLVSLSSDPANLLPPFRAMAAFEPGQGQLPALDLSGISPATKMTVVVGDQDKIKRQCDAVSLWQASSQVPDSNRDFLEVISDAHGTPQQLGNHYFPLTRTYMDTVPPPSDDDRDFNVTWKLSVGILNCAIYGNDCAFALGHGSQPQTWMGNWSDGQAVTPLAWVDNPVTYFAGQCGQ